MSMSDPEPDRSDAASRPSTGWDHMVKMMPLIEQLDGFIDALGCGNGLHDWTHEDTGDPPGHPNRRMSWSRDRLYCRDCGQTATVVLDAPPPGGFRPRNQGVQRITNSDDLALALTEGRDKSSNRWVAVDDMSVGHLWLTVQHALKKITPEEPE
jgi:hypothetical protein